MTSKAWYIVAAGFVATAAAIGMIGLTQAQSTVEGMQRVAMPGKVEVVLPSGLTTLYGETRSKLDGRIIEVDGELEFRCAVSDPQRRPMPIVEAASTVSYRMSGYSGQGSLDVQIEAAGTYVLECAGPRPFVIALGRGIGTWIVIAGAALVPASAGLVMALVVLLKRRRQKRAVLQAATP